MFVYRGRAIETINKHLSAAELAHLIDAANKVCDAGFCKAPALMIMREKKRLPLLWQALALIRAILVG
jgi:hypothetical protein